MSTASTALVLFPLTGQIRGGARNPCQGCNPGRPIVRTCCTNLLVDPRGIEPRPPICDTSMLPLSLRIHLLRIAELAPSVLLRRTRPIGSRTRSLCGQTSFALSPQLVRANATSFSTWTAPRPSNITRGGAARTLPEPGRFAVF